MNAYMERVKAEQQQVADQLVAPKRKADRKKQAYIGNIADAKDRIAAPAPPMPLQQQMAIDTSSNAMMVEPDIDALMMASEEEQAQEYYAEREIAAEPMAQSRGGFFGGGGRRAGRGSPASGSVRETSIRNSRQRQQDNEGGRPVDVRITGYWRKTVIVPPNAWVVQTRRGHDEPIALGLGKSLRFNPKTDAVLVVPATLQTLILSADCICEERQGLLVQGYVQWVVEDFRTAYRKIDFSDPDDPMRIVRTQLREQAEATIKDTVATMSIEKVLADKQPIIKELTRRLRELAEGVRDDDADGVADSTGRGSGLGIKILTVQIKEAVVSSESLWESLQRPYRAEQQRIARLAELASEQEIREAEATSRREQAARELETQAETDRRRAELDAESFARSQQEQARRTRLEAEQQAEALDAQRNIAQQQHELALQAQAHQQEADAKRREYEREQRQADAEASLAIEAKRRESLKPTPEQIALERVKAGPQIAAALPRLEGLESLQLDAGTLRQILAAISGRGGSGDTGGDE